MNSINPAEQQFLNALDRKLWAAADQLRSNVDAAVYKSVVLPLIFLKYASDAFDARRQELERKFRDPNDEYYMDPAVYGLTVEDDIEEELENRDYYREVNVFWVAPEARWQNLRDHSKTAVGEMLPWGKPMRGVSYLLDDALSALARENDKLRDALDRDAFTKREIEPATLAKLIDRFSDTDFSSPQWHGERLNLKSKDMLGHVYEYFLGQFALAEGKKGGQYFTPKSIVTLIVEMLEPYKGRVFDPAMGSGGFFIQNERFIEAHAGERHYDPREQKRRISIYGQESNPTTWRLAVMNMAIRGIEFDFGGRPADSFRDDLHKDLRADFVMANPPFNMKDWGLSELPEDDVRWEYGTPPANNANFAWMQHMLYHLAPTGTMALLLANGSMSSNTSGEGEIRKNLVEADLVECIVALPGQLFINTQIPACIWFLTKNKEERGTNGGKRRKRDKEFLFIDARKKGYMKDRVLRDFTNEDIREIADTYHLWRGSNGKGESERQYEDIAGFCKTATLEQVRKHDYVLTPGRYVGAGEVEDDGELYSERMSRLTTTLSEQFKEGARLEEKIKKNLASLGWSV